ncbi:MAG: isoprenyl transferase [Flavobacteriaceae bacterium]|nr:isoprenyl transferase [Flavobacteriaceae bacterium]
MMQLTELPRHVAIIMDGNGRWAEKMGKPRIYGHHKGVDVAIEIVQEALDLGIPYLTLFAFSKDNWKRPKSEISVIMTLMMNSLKSEFQRIIDSQVKINVIGNLSDLSHEVQEVLEDIKHRTANHKGLQLTLAISYESREEIVMATKSIIKKALLGDYKIEEINQDTINQHLYTSSLPYVDFLIRTSGEQRLSNFLLWQSGYAELFFDDTLWPDFSKDDFHKALNEYNNRERRYGKTGQQIKQQIFAV